MAVELQSVFYPTADIPLLTPTGGSAPRFVERGAFSIDAITVS